MKKIIFKGSEKPDLIEKIGGLRQIVWRSLVPDIVSINRFSIDGHDENAWHVCLLENDNVIASSRLTFHQPGEDFPDAGNFAPVINMMSFPMALMTRLVVAEQHREEGYAGLLDKERLALAMEKGAASTWAEAAGRRVLALQAMGFIIEAPSGDLSIPGDWQLLDYKV